MLERLEDRCVPAISITEFSNGITQPAGPYGIVTGPDGNLWFTEFTANKIARFNPTTGVVTEFAVPTAGSGPQDITVGPDGNLWFTEYNANQIGCFNPNTCTFSEYATPTPNSHPYDITAGPDNNLWFTENGVSQIARITTAGVVTEFGSSAGISSSSGPFDITVGPDRNIWFTENTANQVAKFNLSTDTATEYGHLAARANPQGIVTGPDGNLWFTENGANQIASITTSGTVTEFDTLNGSDPREITAGPDGNLWFTEGNGNAIGSITPAGTVTEYTSGISPNSTPQGITMGPDGNLWFTEFTGGRIGRVQGIPTATTITLSSSDTAPAYGQTVVFTATVGTQLSNGTAPTGGVVVFRDGSQVIGAATVSGGFAVFYTNALSAGTHQITASFTENANYGGSNSAAVTEQVAPSSTSITLSSSASPSPAGQLVTYIATVSATNGSATPTGFVTFSDGNTIIGTSTLSGGLAVLSTTPTVAGNHEISASYTPVANFLPSSTDDPLTEQITAGTATQVLFGQQPTFSFVGTPFVPTVTAYFADSYGNLVNAPGAVTVALATNTTAAALGGYTTEPLVNGVATFPNLTVNKAGSGYTLSATSQGLTGTVSSPFTIGSATHFATSAPTSVQAGANFNLTVSALTAANGLDSLYQGTVSITASNGTTTLTLVAGYTYTTTDKGTHVFTAVQLPTAGHWTITVTDSRKATVVGHATVTVTAPTSLIKQPAPSITVITATHFSVAASTSSVLTGVGFNLTVSALTASNALDTQYQGTVTITAINGTTVTLLPSYTFTTADNGKHVFTGFELPSAGRWTLVVTDVDQPTVVGQAVVTVTVPPPATHFSVAGPVSVLMDTSFNLTATALTAANALAAQYQGTVAITAVSGKTTLTLLPSYTFTTANDGKYTFTGLELPTAGSWTITVSDTGNAAVLGRAVVTVTTPPPVTHFTVSAPTTVTADLGFNLTVTALTAYNTVGTLYQGTVAITATNGTTTVSLLPSYTFTTADDGKEVFSGLELPSAGHWTITVTDVHAATVLGRATVTATAPPAASPQITLAPISMMQATSVAMSPLNLVTDWVASA